MPPADGPSACALAPPRRPPPSERAFLVSTRTPEFEEMDPLHQFPPKLQTRNLRRMTGSTSRRNHRCNKASTTRLEQGCALEELIRFHGGWRAASTRPEFSACAQRQEPGDVREITGQARPRRESGGRSLLQAQSAVAAAPRYGIGPE